MVARIYAASPAIVREFTAAVSGTGVEYAVMGPERPRHADYVITAAQLNADVERFARDLTAKGAFSTTIVVLPEGQDWFGEVLLRAQANGRDVVVVGAELRNPIVR